MKIKGFTPVFDVLVDRFDTNTALVYGKIWRVCDWSPIGICSMSNESLAKQVGLSAKTISRKKEILKEAGLIKVMSVTGAPDKIVVLHEIVLSMDIVSPTPDTVSDPLDNLSETMDTVSYKDIDSKTKIDGAKPAETDEDFWKRKEQEAQAREKAERLSPEEVQAVALGLKAPEQAMDVEFAADVREFAYTFVKVSGMTPTKAERPDWTKTFRFWRSLGVKTSDIPEMWIHASKNWDVGRPGAITKAWRILQNKKGNTPEKRLTNQRQREEQQWANSGRQTL